MTQTPPLEFLRGAGQDDSDPSYENNTGTLQIPAGESRQDHQNLVGNPGRPTLGGPRTPDSNNIISNW